MAVFEEWLISFLSPTTITGVLLTVQLILVSFISYLFFSIKLIAKSISDSKEATEVKIKEIKDTISGHESDISSIKSLVSEVNTTIKHLSNNIDKQSARTEEINRMLFSVINNIK